MLRFLNGLIAAVVCMLWAGATYAQAYGIDSRAANTSLLINDLSLLQAH